MRACAFFQVDRQDKAISEAELSPSKSAAQEAGALSAGISGLLGRGLRLHPISGSSLLMRAAST